MSVCFALQVRLVSVCFHTLLRSNNIFVRGNEPYFIFFARLPSPKDERNPVKSGSTFSDTGPINLVMCKNHRLGDDILKMSDNDLLGLAWRHFSESQNGTASATAY
jgi:hypothetical protein